jgi:integrase
VKLRRMAYTETGPDGRKVKRKSPKWYAVFMDFNGAVRRLPLFEDRGASNTLADNIDRLNSLRAANESTLPSELARAIVDMPETVLAKLSAWDIVRPEKAATTKGLTQHIDDWKAAILADGSTAEHAEKTTGRASRLFDTCGFKTFSDIDSHEVLIALADMRKDRTSPTGKVTRGISPQTSNFYLQAAKQFCVWMASPLNKRAYQSPLVGMEKLNVTTDRRHDRRPLSPEELHWLLDTTERGYSKPGPDGKLLLIVQVVDRYGMSGPDRAMLYRVAVETGFRSSELRSLIRASFQLGVDPNVTIAAAYAKNRRRDTLPLKLDTAAMLEKHFTGKMPVAPVFVMPKTDQIIHMFRADLEAAHTAWIAAAGSQQERTERAGDTFLAYCDDAGRYADFHALRHTFISNLAAGGVHPKTAQRLARHSTITLTMDRYTHLRREDLAGALDTLPDLSSKPQSAVATGTAGAIDSLALPLPPTGGFGRTAPHTLARAAHSAVATQSHGNTEGNTESAADSETGSTRIRTEDQGFMRPLLLPLSYAPDVDSVSNEFPQK